MAIKKCLKVDFGGVKILIGESLRLNELIKISKEIDLENPDELAFVVVDFLKSRRGKRGEGSSLDYDHNSGKTIQGHQLLELGIVSDGGIVPVDRQSVGLLKFISKK